MRDFTISIFEKFLFTLQAAGYTFLPFYLFNDQQKGRSIVLRHDIDRKKYNALIFAKIQYELNIVGTYYFRSVPQSFDAGIISQIADLGHEIGYHYENMDSMHGNYSLAIEDFRLNLSTFREIYPVRTICMHGSPLSKYDNRDLWNKYNYRDYGIIGEPYYDLDFNQVFYLTDTGRRWDGESVSVRDKVNNQRSDIKNWNLKFHSSQEIIRAAEDGRLPDKMMITFHPQRWNNGLLPWTLELVGQNIKNLIKKYYFVKRSNTH